MPDRDEAEQSPVFVDDRQCILAGTEHGRSDFRHVILGSHPWPRPKAEQLVDRQVVSPEWTGGPLQRDIAFIEHSDRTDAIVDHDQVPIVFAVELTPRAEQRSLRIDRPRTTGHHVGCCWQSRAPLAGLRVVGFLPFPCRRDAVDHIGHDCSSLLGDCPLLGVRRVAVVGHVGDGLQPVPRTVGR